MESALSQPVEKKNIIVREYPWIYIDSQIIRIFFTTPALQKT